MAAKDLTGATDVQLSPAQRMTILKALADPKRFELLERVAAASCPMGCAEVRLALAISPATLSHHVRELETAGLVHVEREGKFVYLTPRCETWSALLESLATIGGTRKAEPAL